MSQKQDQTKALFELWEIVLRYRWRFILSAFAACTVILCLSLALPRKYKAEGIFERRTDMVLTEMMTKGATRSFQDPRASLVKEIAGPPAVDHLLRTLEPELRQRGFIKTDVDRQNLRADLLRRVVVHWDISSSVMDQIRVEYIGSHPELAKLVVNGLIRNHMERDRAVMQQRLQESAAFFQSEVSISRTQIEKLEDRILKFEMEHADVLPDNPSNVGTRLTEFQTQLSDLIAQRDAAAIRVESLTKALAETPETIPTVVRGPNPELAELRKRLRDLNDQYDMYTGKYKMTEAHPDLVALKQEIALVQTKLETIDKEVVTETQIATNPRVNDLKLRLEESQTNHQALSQQVASLENQANQMTGQTASMFAVRSEYQKLTRQQQEVQRQLAFWEDNLRRVQLAVAADSGNRAIQLTFVQPAHAASKPVSPDLAQVVMAAIGMGLLAGGLSVFFAHRSDESFANGEDLAKTYNLPLLGGVSELVSSKHRRIQQIRAAIVYPTTALAMAAVLVGVTTLLYVDLEKPQAMATLKASVWHLVAGDSTPQPATDSELSAVPTDMVN